MSNAGQAALAIVGSIVGFAVGGPAGAAYGFQLGLAVGTLVSPTQLPGTFGPRLQDKRTTNVELGTPITELFGRDVVTGTIIWLGEIIETSMTEDVGGKGAPEGSNTTYSYKQSIAIGLCRGPQSELRRIWENGKLVYDTRIIDGESADDFLQRVASNELYASGFTLYQGDEAQLPDPTIEEKEGVGNVPAYRGLAYIVYIERTLRDDQALRHPSFKFELDASETGGGDSFIIPGVLFVTEVPGSESEPYFLRALTFNDTDSVDVVQFEDTFDSSGINAVDVCGKGTRVFAIGNLSTTQYWARFSNDGGETFAVVLVGAEFGTPPTTVQPFSCDMSSDSYLIVCSGMRQPTDTEALVYSSSDSGQAWGNCVILAVESDFRFSRVKYIEPADIWLCGGFRGIAKSLDGITWYQPLSGGVGAILDFAYGAVTTVAAVTSSSIYASTDDGETWSLAYNGGFSHRGLAFCNFTWCRYDAGIFGVIDGGFSVATSVAGPWSAIATAPAGWDIRDLISDGQKFIAVGKNGVGATLIGVSTDGVTWTVASEGHVANARINRAKNRWTSI